MYKQNIMNTPEYTAKKHKAELKSQFSYQMISPVLSLSLSVTERRR